MVYANERLMRGLMRASDLPLFASFFGRSSLDESSAEHQLIIDVTEILFANNFGIIHGGYDCGVMKAVSDTANCLIAQHQLSPYSNIGVPCFQFDHNRRSPGANHTEVASNIYQRLEFINSGDISVVAPVGGYGTELELSIAFHENFYCSDFDPDHAITPKHIICLQTANGTDWLALAELKLRMFNPSGHLSDYPWLHFIHSAAEFSDLIQLLKDELLDFKS